MSIKRWGIKQTSKIIKLAFNYLIYLYPTIDLKKTGQAGLILLTCHRDIPMIITAMQSFYYSSRLNLPCIIIDDGTLTQKDKITLKGNFKNLEIWSSQKTKKKSLKKLKKYPYCHLRRKSDSPDKMQNMRRIKFFDLFLTTPFEKNIFFDSDVLFLNKPTEIIKWAKNPKDKRILYSNQRKNKSLEIIGGSRDSNIISRMLYFRKNKQLPYFFNSGLLCFPKDFYKLRMYEKQLKYMYQVGLQETWAAGQFILSTMIFKTNHRELPFNEYPHLRIPSEAKKIFPAKIFSKKFIHFSFKSKPLFWLTALVLTIKTKLFQKNYERNQD